MDYLGSILYMLTLRLTPEDESHACRSFRTLSRLSLDLDPLNITDTLNLIASKALLDT